MAWVQDIRGAVLPQRGCGLPHSSRNDLLQTPLAKEFRLGLGLGEEPSLLCPLPFGTSPMRFTPTFWPLEGVLKPGFAGRYGARMGP